MFYPLIILFSTMVLVALVVIKLPLMMWYRRFKMRIWHWFIILKIERKMQKKKLSLRECDSFFGR